MCPNYSAVNVSKTELEINGNLPLFFIFLQCLEYRSENQYKIKLQLCMEVERKKSSSWYCFEFLLCSMFNFIVRGIYM